MSASGPTLLPAFFNTDAEFRQWAQAFHDALTAAGWVNTADTGQINLSTVAKPAATNTAQGYEIWRMADAQQSVLPCFLKIEYGSGGAVDRPALWFTTATGANGSGTLTGNVTGREQITMGASKTAGVTLPSYFSGNTDRFAFVTGYDNANTSFGLVGCIERTADVNGTATADGVISFFHGPGDNSTYVLPPVAIGVPGAFTTGPFWDLASPALTTVGNNVAAMPGIVMVGKPFFFRSFCSYKNTDIAGGTSITITTSSGTHTYTTFSTSGINPTSQSAAVVPLAMIFE